MIAHAGHPNDHIPAPKIAPEVEEHPCSARSIVATAHVVGIAVDFLL